jgi:hypothetical protein
MDGSCRLCTVWIMLHSPCRSSDAQASFGYTRIHCFLAAPSLRGRCIYHLHSISILGVVSSPLGFTAFILFGEFDYIHSTFEFVS